MNMNNQNMNTRRNMPCNQNGQCNPNTPCTRDVPRNQGTPCKRDMPRNQGTPYAQNRSMPRQNAYMQDMRKNEMNTPECRKDCDMDRDKRPVPDRRMLMKEIYQLGFALVETVLYLDTHPADADALNYYHQIKKRYHMVMEMYAKEYGPLLNSNVMNENYWSWVATPMPWEVEGC